MKAMIWNLVKRIFQAEISAESQAYCLNESSIFRQKQMAEKRKATLINYPIGTKVILRSNEPNDLVIGPVMGYQDLGENREILLIIKDEQSGQEFSSLDNTPPHWSQEKEDALNKLNWAEQWNAMMKGHYVIDPEFKLERERSWAKKDPTQLTKNT